MSDEEMPKARVTIGEGAGETLVRDAKKPVIITDERGRKIKLEKPSTLGQFRLIRMLGEAAKNITYVQMLLPLLFVTAVEDDPVHFPASEREIEALIQRLDDEGIAAVMKGVEEHFAAADPEAAAAELKP